jgi:hypothetical protein
MVGGALYLSVSTKLNHVLGLVIATCKELGITNIGYSYALLSRQSPHPDPQTNSPLGRGLLTGQFKSRTDFEEGDFRRAFSRFQDDVSTLRASRPSIPC